MNPAEEGMEATQAFDKYGIAAVLAFVLVFMAAGASFFVRYIVLPFRDRLIGHFDTIDVRFSAEQEDRSDDRLYNRECLGAITKSMVAIERSTDQHAAKLTEIERTLRDL